MELALEPVGPHLQAKVALRKTVPAHTDQWPLFPDSNRLPPWGLQGWPWLVPAVWSLSGTMRVPRAAFWARTTNRPPPADSRLPEGQATVPCLVRESVGFGGRPGLLEGLSVNIKADRNQENRPTAWVWGALGSSGSCHAGVPTTPLRDMARSSEQGSGQRWLCEHQFPGAGDPRDQWILSV